MKVHFCTARDIALMHAAGTMYKIHPLMELF